MNPTVVSLVWNLIRGGTEGQCARTACWLAETGWPVRVAVFRREGFFLPQVEQICGPCYHLDIQRMFSPRTLGQVHSFANWLRVQRADVLHTWDADAAIFGALAARWAGVPLITSRRDLGEIYPPHKRWLMGRADRQAVAVVANAGVIADRFATRGVLRHKLRVIGNILDLVEFDRLAALPPPISLPVGPLVGMVARLDREKDAGLLLRAAARLVARHPQVHFVLAGDGPERTSLAALANQPPLAGRVHLLGDITWVPALVHRFTVGVLTSSRNEGLSNTLLEYLAAGVPFVATDCGGNRELAERNAAGEVVPVGDEVALAEALDRLLSRPEERQLRGERGRRQVEQHHQPAGVARQFDALYREVVRA